MATYTLDRFPPPTVPPAAPSAPVLGDWWRVEREGVGQGRRKGRKRTSEPCSTAAAAGAYRGKLAGRTVPTDLGACWARHRFPPRVTVCVAYGTRSYLCVCVHGRVAQGGPFVGEGAGEDLFVHTCTHSRGEGWKGVPLSSPPLLSYYYYYCFTPALHPWPLATIVSKAGAGESRSGEKRSGEHTP